jgi:uncharacterized protein (TIGR00251 family)
MSADKPTGPVTATDDGVTVAVRVTPKASRSQVGDTVADSDGCHALMVSVTSAPESGKANAAVVALLSKTWHVPKSSISIQSGTTARRKILRIKGNARKLAHIINSNIAGTGNG